MLATPRRLFLLLALLASPLAATIDRESDGISDIWSNLYPTAGAPQADPDGDGSTNLNEALAGTDPTSAACHFAAAPERDPDGNLVLHWSSVVGKQYQIGSSADLSNWVDFSPPRLGDGTTIVIIVSPAGTATPARQFWRVSVSDTDTDSDTLNNWEEAQLGTDPDVANVTPTITTQPQSTTVTVGQTATFSVTAIGTGTLSYQWWRNGEALGGATSASYTTPPAQIGHDGVSYQVVVSSNGATSSHNALLTVHAASALPVISSFSASAATITAGQSSILNWSVNGATRLSLDHKIGVVTGTSFSVIPACTSVYTLKASNANGAVTATATVWVGPSQPGTVPGAFEYRAQTLPSLNSITARPATDNPIYGIYAWNWEVDDVLFQENFRIMGLKSLRLGGRLFEHHSYWTALRLGDMAFQHLPGMGMEVMYTCQLEGSARTREGYASDDAFLDAYAANISAVLSRYGPGGAFWVENPGLPYRPILSLELWNEPNFQYMYPSGSDAQRKALYAKLLSRAYAHIKATWPMVRVVGFGAGGASAADKGFIDSVLKASITPATRSSFDVLSTHPYVENRPPEAYVIQSWGAFSIAQSLSEIRASLGAGGDTMPIWYTEVGWQISKSEGGAYDIAATHTVSRMLQGAYICRMYAWALRLGVDRVHIMYPKDVDGYNGGIFDKDDATMRESAHAIKNMIRLMPHPKLVGAISDNVDGFSAYQFRSDATNTTSPEVIMLWNGIGPRTVTLSLSAGTYRVINMLGAERTESAGSGSLQLEVGPYPTYLVRIP